MSSRLLPIFAAAILISVGATAAVACDGEKSRSAKATSAYSAAAAKSCATKGRKDSNSSKRGESVLFGQEGHGDGRFRFSL